MFRGIAHLVVHVLWNCPFGWPCFVELPICLANVKGCAHIFDCNYMDTFSTPAQNIIEKAAV